MDLYLQEAKYLRLMTTKNRSPTDSNQVVLKKTHSRSMKIVAQHIRHYVINMLLIEIRDPYIAVLFWNINSF